MTNLLRTALLVLFVELLIGCGASVPMASATAGEAQLNCVD